MNPEQYKQARKTLGLNIQQAGSFLQVSSATAQRYAQEGLKGPAEVAIRMALKHGLQTGEGVET